MFYANPSPTPEATRRAFPWKAVLAAVLLFCVVLCFYGIFLTGEDFQDEMDVFIVGSEVAYGAEMYKTTVSQHMPFSYYLTAIITLLVHPGSLDMYRFCLYVFLSALWTAIFLRYRKKVNPVALVLLPVLYISVLTLYSNGSMMLSEHWAGIGHVILLLEILCYIRDRRLSTASCLWISFSILLSFGCVFTSAYSIAITAVGVFLYQIWMMTFGTEKARRAECVRTVLLDDARLLACVLLPWAVLMGYYAVTGNLENFYYSVFQFNVDVYSRYTPLGTDAWGTFTSILPSFWGYLQSHVSALFAGDFTPENLAGVLYSVCPAVVAVILLFRNPVLAFTYLFSTAAVAIRGYDHFHALHFMCACCLSICLLAGEGIRLPVGRWKQPLTYAGCVCGVLVIGFFVYPWIPSALKSPGLYTSGRLNMRSTETRELTDVITDPGDKLHFSDFYTTTIDTGRPIDYGPACSTPWTWDGFGERELKALSENQTKVVFYEPDFSVWGYARDEYAADFVKVLKEDYFPLSQTIYIRRSYLPEAVRRMIKAGIDDYLEFYDAVPLTAQAQESTVSLSRLGEAAMAITPSADCMLELVEFWPSRSGDTPLCGVHVSVVDTADGTVLAEQTAPGRYLADGEMNLVYFDSLVIRGGSTYEIRLAPDGEGDVLLATAALAENDFQARSPADLGGENLAVRMALETADPSYAVSYDAFGGEEEEEEPYEEEEEEDMESGIEDDGLGGPFGSWDGGEESNEEEEEDGEGV